MESYKKMTLKRFGLYLSLIVALAMLLRLVGIGYGIREGFRPDEDTTVQSALKMSQTFDFNPHEFKYPSLQRYLLAPFYTAENLLELEFYPLTETEFPNYYRSGTQHPTLSDRFYSRKREWTAHGHINPEMYMVFARLLTILMGTMTVLLAGLIVRQFYGDYWGLLAAGLLAVNFLHVRDSHFVTLDVPATFWVVLVIWYCCRMVAHGKWSDYLLAGLFTGFAAGTKYNMLLVFLPVCMSHGCYMVKQHLPFLHWKTHQKFIVAGCMVLAGFYLTNPFVFHDFDKFKWDFQWEVQHMKQGHFKLNDIPGWKYHTLYTLPYGLGWGIYVLSIWGILVSFWKRNHLDWMLGAFIIPYFLAFALGKTIFVRYMIPLIPFLCIYAIRGIYQLSEWMKTIQFSQKLVVSRVTAILLMGAVLLPGLAKSAYYDYILSQDDTRIQAAKWIESHLPYNSRMGVITYFLVRTLPKTYYYRLASVHDTSKFVNDIELDVFKQNDWMFDVDYYMLDFHPIIYSIRTNQLSALSQDTPIAQFTPMSNPRRVPGKDDFNNIDAFYVPYKNIFNYVRPGPLIYIYQADTTRNIAAQTR